MDDNLLDAAAEEVAAEEVVEEVVEEAEEEVESEETETEEPEELPAEHQERSKLGRKVSAMFRKADKLEETLAAQAEITSRLVKYLAPEEEEEDTFVTKKELEKTLSAPQEQQAKYEQEFKQTFTELCDELSEEDVEGVTEVFFEKYNTQVKGDGKIDAAIAFERAKADYMAPRKMPFKQGKASGVVTKQSTKKTVQKPAKLDAACESLLASIERMDGIERANKLRKKIQ